jgi:nicotinate phosphoribosyltransferase
MSGAPFGLPFDADALATLRVTMATPAAHARAAFECSFASQESSNLFIVTSGLEAALEALEAIELSPLDAAWLVDSGLWDEATVEAVGSMRLSIDMDAVPEGTVVFPGTPVVTVEGPFWQTQLVASLVARAFSQASSIATRVARMCLAHEHDGHDGRAHEFELVEVTGARELGAERACRIARAAYLGGATATTSPHAARMLGLPLKTRQSAVGQAAAASSTAYHRAWLEHAPHGAIARLETVDVEGAAERFAVAAEARVHESWDAEQISLEIPGGNYAEAVPRIGAAFRARDLPEPKVFVSGLLDEYALASLRREIPTLAGACVDVTRLPPLLELRPELVALEEDGQWSPRIRVTESAMATSDPGRKIVMRYLDADDRPVADVAHANNERMQPARSVEFLDRVTGEAGKISAARSVPLRLNVMRAGRRTSPREDLEAIRVRAMQGVASLPNGLQALRPSESYPVGLTPTLYALKQSLLSR